MLDESLTADQPQALSPDHTEIVVHTVNNPSWCCVDNVPSVFTRLWLEEEFEFPPFAPCSGHATSGPCSRLWFRPAPAFRATWVQSPACQDRASTDRQKCPLKVSPRSMHLSFLLLSTRGRPKLDLNVAQRLAASQKGTCLSTEYINSWTPMLWRCQAGHSWAAQLRSVRCLRSWCPMCRGKRGAQRVRDLLRP